MTNARYNVEYVPVEGDEKQLLWQTQGQVLSLFRKMGNGDDLVIHRTDQDAVEGALYP